MAFDEEAVSRDLTEKVNTLLTERTIRTACRYRTSSAHDSTPDWRGFISPKVMGDSVVPQSFQRQVNAQLEAAGAPGPATGKNGIGLGMAAPTIAAFGTEEQKQKFLRPFVDCGDGLLPAVQ